MVKNAILWVCTLTSVYVNAQTYNVRSRLNHEAAQYGAMVVKDSFIYCSGIVADTISPFRTVNVFSKRDLYGNLLSCSIFKGDSGESEIGTFGNSLITTHDYGFALTGYTILNNEIKALFIKYDSTGNVEFYKTYRHPNSLTFFGYSIIEHGSDFYIQGSLSYASYDRGLFLIKIDRFGNEQWRKYYGSNSTDEMAAAFIKTGSNRLLIAAQKNNRKYSDYHLFKSWSYLLLLDTAGNIVRDTVGEDENMGVPQSLIETQDGNFVYCTNYYVGKFQWLGYFTKGYVSKVDSNLNTLWEGKFGDSSTLTGLHNIVEFSTGELVTVGTNYDATYTSTSDYHNNGLIIKLDAQGNQLWRHDYRGVTRIGQQLEDNILHDCEILSDGSIIACGIAQDNNDTFPQQAWLLRINADGCMDDGFCGYTDVGEVEKEIREQAILKVYPSPAQNSITIEYSDLTENSVLHIVNILGVPVESLPLKEVSGKLTLNTSTYINGIYLARIESADKAAIKSKFIIQK